MGYGALRLARERAAAARGAAPPPAPTLPSTLSRDEHSRIVQELTVRYEKELSRLRAAAPVPEGALVMTVEEADEMQRQFAALDEKARELETERDKLVAELDQAKAEAAKLADAIAQATVPAETAASAPAASEAPEAKPEPEAPKGKGARTKS